MQLHGPTLTLRYPHRDDAERLYELASDPAVTEWFSWGPYTDLEQPRAWIAAQHQRRESGTQLDLVIDHHSHGVIGVTGLTELSVRDRRAIVGTWFGRRYWGSGGNPEAKALIAYLAFAVCGMERIGAYANPLNGRSVRALEKVGFRHEGTLRGWHRHAGRQLDVHIVGILLAEWQAGACSLQGAVISVADMPPPCWLLGDRT